MKSAAKNAAALAAFLLFAAAVGIALGCPIKLTTGLPCPGCGLTRACFSLLRLDFAGAFFWHPLCFLVPPLGLMFIFKDTSRGSRFWHSTRLMAALTAACLAVYVVRMALLFPHTAPMDFEKNALIVKIVHRFILH